MVQVCLVMHSRENYDDVEKISKIMEDKALQHIFVTLLCAVLNHKKLENSVIQSLSNDVMIPLCRLAKKHDLSHVISEILYQNKIEVDDDLRLRLQQQHYVSVCRCEQIKYAHAQICKVFEDAQIDYIPLKGAVLRAYYPVESMRTSCDIDILIHEQDIGRAISKLQQNGYECGVRNFHDVSLFAPNKIHLELHFNVLEKRKNLDKILENAWHYTVKTEKANQYAFTDEFFVFHTFAHMAYHFIRGGCGIRSLMDIWIMEHKMGLTYLQAETLLKQADIYRFAQEMSRISQLCFSENQTDEFADAVLDYILVGGVYGSTKNYMVVKKVKANNTFGYMLSRLFLPMDGMKSSYPVLNKVPILLPFCWVARWFGMLFGGKLNNAVNELSRTCSISESQMQRIRDIFLRLEL